MKRFLLTALCAWQLLYANGQIVQPGLKMGASFPDLKNESSEAPDYSSRMAPFFGVSISEKLSNWFRIQEELNYSPQGGRRTGMQPVGNDFPGLNTPENTTVFASYKDEFRLNYIELPVLLQLLAERPQQGDSKIFYFANIGPCVSFLLNAKHITKGSSLLYADEQGSIPLRTQDGLLFPAQSFDSKTDVSKAFKKMNVSLVGSIGTGYNFSGQRFFLEARFTRGLMNIEADGLFNQRFTTSSLVFVAGYVYSFE